MMLELMQDGKYAGGTVFKIDTGVKEVVRTEVPMIVADEDRRREEDVAKTRDRVYGPVREVLKGERGVARDQRRTDSMGCDRRGDYLQI